MKEITSKDDLNAALNGSPLVVIKFKVSWCPSCKRMGPVFNELSKKYLDVLFCTVDIEEAKDLAAEFDIRKVPTFVLYKYGNKVYGFTGANPDALEKNIQELKRN